MSERELKLEYALALMVYQYCNDGETLYHQHISAGEEAFEMLGLEDMDSADKLWERIEKMEEEFRERRKAAP